MPTLLFVDDHPQALAIRKMLLETKGYAILTADDGPSGIALLREHTVDAVVLDYKMPAGTSLQETNRVLMHIEKYLGETPEIESYSRRTGARLALAIAEPNTGDFLIKLKKNRDRSLEDVTSELRKKIVGSEQAIEVEFPHILEDLVGDMA